MLNNKMMHDRRYGRVPVRMGCGCNRDPREYREDGAPRTSTEERNRGGACGCNDARDRARENGCGCNDARDRNREGTCPLCNRGEGRQSVQSPCNPGDNTNCQKLLDQIRTVDFALVELVLYLDAYPDSCEALDTYHKLIARRKGLWQQYESACGPLTAMGNKSTETWDWVKTPFPWEYSAN